MGLLKRLVRAIHARLMRLLFGGMVDMLSNRMLQIERRQVIHDTELLNHEQQIQISQEHLDRLNQRLKRSVYEITQPTIN